MLAKLFFRRLQIFFNEACKASALKIVKFLQAFQKLGKFFTDSLEINS